MYLFIITLFAFDAGKLNDDDTIENFSRKYVVENRLVKQYVDHLLELERKRNKRTESRKRAEPGREPKIFCRLQLGSNVSRRNAKETES